MGDTLYPLNQLRAVNPELYAEQAKKYQGREQVMENPVPILDCLWNDVLHFSPFHPKKIKNALFDAGMTVPTLRAFEVDPYRLELNLTVLYLYLQHRSEDKYDWSGNFVPFEPGMLVTRNELPERTKTYYRKTIAAGKNPLAFVGVPHVLYKGSIDISDAEVIRV